MKNETLKTGMVLAAGLGKRLRPFTNKIPKPLLVISDRTILDFGLERFIEADLETIVVNVHHLANQIKAHIKTKREKRIVISDESKALMETGGGVKNALPILGSKPFYVINGDVIWIDGSIPALKRLADFWDSNRMDGLLMLHSTAEAYGYSGMGDFLMDPIGRLSRRPERVVSPYLFTGTQILNPQLFNDTPDSPFSLNLLYDKSIEVGRLFGIVHDGDWFHVGSPEGLNQANQYFKQRYPGIRRR